MKADQEIGSSFFNPTRIELKDAAAAAELCSLAPSCRKTRLRDFLAIS